jgi:hypothetical protein
VFPLNGLQSGGLEAVPRLLVTSTAEENAEYIFRSSSTKIFFKKMMTERLDGSATYRQN